MMASTYETWWCMDISSKFHFTLGVHNKITESFYKLRWEDCFFQDIIVCFPFYVIKVPGNCPSQNPTGFIALENQNLFFCLWLYRCKQTGSKIT